MGAKFGQLLELCLSDHYHRRTRGRLQSIPLISSYKTKSSSAAVRLHCCQKTMIEPGQNEVPPELSSTHCQTEEHPTTGPPPNYSLVRDLLLSMVSPRHRHRHRKSRHQSPQSHCCTAAVVGYVGPIYSCMSYQLKLQQSRASNHTMDLL